MGREVLYKMFAERGFKVGTEIGVQAGINAVDMFKHIPGLTLYLIDPWEENKRFDAERAYRRARRRIRHYDAIIIRKKSEDAARDIPDNSLDFVYLDGDHSYDSVMLDIIMWARKIKPSGIMSGHDYRKNRFGVRNAVSNYVWQHKINLKFSEGRNWYWEM